MTQLDTILHELKSLKTEVLTLREIVEDKDIAYCDKEKALKILGLTNERNLAHYASKGLLSRIGKTRNFKYIKSELYVLSEKIRNNEV